MDVQQGPRPVSSVSGERVARSDGALAAGDHRDCGGRSAPVPAACPRCQPGESPRGEGAAGHVFGGTGDGELTAGNGVVDSQCVSGWGLDAERLAGHYGRRCAERVPGGGGGGQDGWEVSHWVSKRKNGLDSRASPSCPISGPSSLAPNRSAQAVLGLRCAYLSAVCV